jgi:hypothetical protein
MGALASCSDDGPAGTTNSSNQTGKGEVDPQGDPDFFLGSAAIDGVPDGRIDVWAYNLTVHQDSTDSNSTGTVVAFDVVLINRSRTALYAPITFLIPLIIPDGVSVLNSEIFYITDITEGPPGFDFSDDLGDDNKLDPREHSAPVNMQFGMRELTSFSIGFEITVGSPPPPPGEHPDISGVVFNDVNENGERDSTEEGISGINVQLSTNTPNTDPFVFVRLAQTDRQGRYGFSDLRPGIYQVEAAPNSDLKSTTPNPLIVTLIGDSSGVIPIRGINFGFFVKEPPDVDPIFGPVGVGPGSNHGEDFEGGFWVRDLDKDHKYVLQVVPPPIMSSSPMVMRIKRAEAWINQEHVYKFECDSDSTTTNSCLPFERVSIPNELLREGANRIRIRVEGSERAFLMFTIFRVSDPAGP